MKKKARGLEKENIKSALKAVDTCTSLCANGKRDMKQVILKLTGGVSKDKPLNPEKIYRSLKSDAIVIQVQGKRYAIYLNQLEVKLCNYSTWKEIALMGLNYEFKTLTLKDIK